MTVLRSDTPALDIAGLAFSYGGRFALQDVSFAVPPGAFTALLGPNGAGKTTLFSLITHLFTGGRGTIRIGGWDIRRESRKALAQMGVVFQQPTLDLDRSYRMKTATSDRVIHLTAFIDRNSEYASAGASSGLTDCSRAWGKKGVIPNLAAQ